MSWRTGSLFGISLMLLGVSLAMLVVGVAGSGIVGMLGVLVAVIAMAELLHDDQQVWGPEQP